MKDFISQNNLKVLEKYSNISDEDFKIYLSPNNELYYSINFMFVEPHIVSSYIIKHEQEVKEEEQRKIREIEQERVREQNRLNAQRLFEQQQAQMRLRIQQENERQRLIEIERQRRIESERNRLEQQRIDRERRNNPFQ
jgi:hypothetical protein